MTNRLLKSTGLMAASCIVAACSGIQHQMPESSQAEEFAALTEIEASSDSLPNYKMSDIAAKHKLLSIYEEIRPAAQEVCNHSGETYECAWIVMYSNSQEYQALAGPGNQIIVTHRVISASETDDEIAYVLAHEIGHHIADHIDDTRKQANAGILIAGMAMAVLSHYSGGCYSSSCLNALQNTSMNTMNLGANVATRVFSKGQEKEADYLATYIVHRAGYNLNLSRAAVVKIGAMSEDTETNFMDSHPAGPQRLANYDKFVEVIQNDADGLPGERSIEETKSVMLRNNTAVKTDAHNQDLDPNIVDPKKCRLYIPADNICIH